MGNTHTTNGIKNLVYINSTERAKELGRKGGLANKNNPKTIISAKLREMKKRGMNDDDVKWFVARLDDPYVNMIHMEKHLESVKDNIAPDKYITLMKELHRTRFGDKLQINQTQVNVNVEMSKDDVDELLELLNNNK